MNPWVKRCFIAVVVLLTAALLILGRISGDVHYQGCVEKAEAYYPPISSLNDERRIGAVQDCSHWP